MSFYEGIPAELFQDTKTKLKEYLKENNDVILRDHCHWAGKFRYAALSKKDINNEEYEFSKEDRFLKR